MTSKSRDMKELEMVNVVLKTNYKRKYEKTIASPEDLVEVLGNEIKNMANEVVIVGNLDTKGRIINASVISMGTIDRSLVSPKNVYASAILSNANSVIALHNHPSGDVTPSRADLNLTKMLAAAGKVLGIELLDHVIVSHEGKYHSIRANEEWVINNAVLDVTIKEDEEWEI